MTYQPPGDYGPPPPDPAHPAFPPVQGYRPPPPYTDPYSAAYGSPYGYGQFPPRMPNDGMAIASLVVSCVAVVGLCGYGVGGLIGIVGAILGHVSRRRIKQTGAGGDGMALAGIITGWVAAGIAVLAIAAIIVLIVLVPDDTSSY